MGEIASRAQLRISYLRWALVTVPAVVLLGFGSATLSGSNDDSLWYQALAKPEVTPPGWLFPIAWTILYVLMGLALAMILNARGARARGLAIALFIVQLAINLVWSPLFFGEHQVSSAFWVIVLMVIAAVATTIVFGRIRSAAAWLMVPYLVWISFAAVLNFSIDRMNPDAETLVPMTPATQISL